jgi:uncharacterized protein
MKRFGTTELARTALTLVIAALGAALAVTIDFPAPFLTGPAISVTIAGLLGLKLDMPKPLANLAFILIGMSIGAGVTPEIMVTARQWPASFLMLAGSLVVIMVLCSLLLRRAFGYDRNSAILAASPGHLAYVLGLSTDANADIRTISLVQSIRVLCITLIVPFAVTMMGGSMEGLIEAPETMSLAAIAVTVALSIVAGLILNRLHVPAALLLGGMLVSTVTHLTGTISGGMPDWLGLPAFLIMGALIGSRFSGVTVAMLRDAVGAGLATTFISGAVAGLFAVIVALWLDLPMAQLVIAFMPGGVEAMVAMAVIMNADPTFVAGHHVMRLFILTLLVPLMLGRRRPPPAA